ncbi:hypothetical protein C8F01DRAFT_1352042 [Mycena amicta]|nr:hypothetical protein C8F01DRAFT_1352042 [Mycena amicta]
MDINFTYLHSIKPDEGTSILQNGWIRVNSSNVANEYSRRIYSEDCHSEGWIAQANHIFTALNINCKLESYFLVHGIQCVLHLRGTIESLPPGHLFLCPSTQFEKDSPGSFGIPSCAAYWSHDPSGVERLSVEDARNLGFPHIDLKMSVAGLLWDGSVYNGVYQFHEAKGFNPASQDVARELGYPLFEATDLHNSAMEFEAFDSAEDNTRSQEEDHASNDADSMGRMGVPDRFDTRAIFYLCRGWYIIICVQLGLIMLFSAFSYQLL